VISENILGTACDFYNDTVIIFPFCIFQIILIEIMVVKATHLKDNFILQPGGVLAQEPPPPHHPS
jgi:hypothetical protein